VVLNIEDRKSSLTIKLSTVNQDKFCKGLSFLINNYRFFFDNLKCGFKEKEVIA
jgi:hypothetical protein